MSLQEAHLMTSDPLGCVLCLGLGAGTVSRYSMSGRPPPSASRPRARYSWPRQSSPEPGSRLPVLAASPVYRRSSSRSTVSTVKSGNSRVEGAALLSAWK